MSIIEVFAQLCWNFGLFMGLIVRRKSLILGHCCEFISGFLREALYIHALDLPLGQKCSHPVSLGGSVNSEVNECLQFALQSTGIKKLFF